MPVAPCFRVSGLGCARRHENHYSHVIWMKPTVEPYLATQKAGDLVSRLLQGALGSRGFEHADAKPSCQALPFVLTATGLPFFLQPWAELAAAWLRTAVIKSGRGIPRACWRRRRRGFCWALLNSWLALVRASLVVTDLAVRRPALVTILIPPESHHLHLQRSRSKGKGFPKMLWIKGELQCPLPLPFMMPVPVLRDAALSVL